MKKLLGIFLVVFDMVTTTLAQKVSVSKVPAVVKTTFAENHPGIKVSWALEKQNYEAGFTLNGKENSEVYSIRGVLLETEVSIQSGELPAPVLSKLKGIKIAEAAKITNSTGAIIYEAEVKGQDLLFNANGNLLKL